MAHSLWKIVWQFLLKLKNGLPIQLGSCILGCLVQRNKNITKMCIQMFIMSLYIISPNWKPPKFPSVAEWLNKLRYCHTMKYHLAIKRNELLMHIATWTNFKGGMLSKSTNLKGYILYDSIYIKF